MNDLHPLTLTLLILVVLLLLVLIFLVIRQQKLKNSELKLEMKEQQMDLIDRLDMRFDGSSDQLMQALTYMSQTNQQTLKESNQTFHHVLEKLTRIDESQKQIDSLTQNITELQAILSDKQARGAFGEVQLNQLLASVFGEKNDKLYQTQFTFSTGVRSDAVVFGPEPLGIIAIDSKFPLENYRRLADQNLDNSSRNESIKKFEQDCKKHINDVSNKYIIPHETGNQAILFIPAEAVFAYINAYLPEIVTYAAKRHVWIVSPTTLMATLTTLLSIIQNIERNKYSSQIHRELNKLGIEFERYQKRWNDLSKRIELLTRDVHDIHTTSDKISKQFEQIQNVEIE